MKRPMGPCIGGVTPAGKSFSLGKKKWGGGEEDGEKVERGGFFCFVFLSSTVFLVPSFKNTEGSPGEPNEGAGGEEETFVFQE